MKKLLLHTCCAICAGGAIAQLKEQYELTCYYYNPNIHPEEEYKKRRDQSRDYCDKIGVDFTEAEYEPAKWFETVKGLENEPEGGARCGVCIKMRLEQTARFAKANGFDIFSATITMGRNKKADYINPLGKIAGEKFAIEFLEADFKKHGGQDIARAVAKEENFYHQNYCGCSFSLASRNNEERS